MSTQASFQRRIDDPDSVVFEVTPARGSIAFLARAIAGVVFGTLIFEIIAAMVLQSWSLGFLIGLVIAGASNGSKISGITSPVRCCATP